MKTNNVQDLIERLLTVVKGNREWAPDVSEREGLRALVDFANTGEWPKLPPRREPGDVEVLARMRRGFRIDLRALVDGRLTAADKKRIYAAADKILMVPSTGVDGAVLYQYVPASFEAVVAHALRLLLASPQDQEDLKQCVWHDCNRFFFVSQRREAAAASGKALTGKRPDRYCCEEHMRAAHRERATAATIARRKELRKLRTEAAARAAAKHK